MPKTAFQSILITGASSGIGAALAKTLAQPDRRLCLLARSEERLQHIARLCRDQGADVQIALLDVRQQNEMAEQILGWDDAMPFDLVIANAGVGKSFEDYDMLRQTVDVNISGVINTIEPILPRMKLRGSGQIGIMSSLAGFRAFGGPAGYAASKAWARLYGEALRGRYHKYNIGVSVICPGFVDTPMLDMDKKPDGVVMPEDAANLIVTGLLRNQSRIVFPKKLGFQIWFLSLLPAAIAERLVSYIRR